MGVGPGAVATPPKAADVKPADLKSNLQKQMAADPKLAAKKDQVKEIPAPKVTGRSLSGPLTFHPPHVLLCRGLRQLTDKPPLAVHDVPQRIQPSIGA